MYIRKVSIYLILIVLFITSFLFPQPQTILADGPLTFFKVNNKLIEPYPSYSISKYFFIPQSQVGDTFRPGQKINLAVDVSLLMPSSDIDLNQVIFKIDTGDGHTYQAGQVIHEYDKPGSYIVKVTADKPVAQADDQGNIESVLINVVPSDNYHLPQPKISIDGKITDYQVGLYEFNSDRTLHFDAHDSLAGTSQITKYQWDFGNGGSNDIATEHKYNLQPDDMPIVFLRTTDQNGLFADTFVMLQNRQPTKTPTTNTANTNKIFPTSGIQNRSYSFYQGIKTWLQQTIERFGNKGEPISIKTIFVVLVIAMFLGSLHSLTPGHSKSIMSAILIGKKDSRVKDVFILSASITFTHTIVIYLLGLLMLVLDKNALLSKIMPYFTILNISLVIVLGLWLVTKGVRAGIHQRWHRVHVGNNKELAHVHNHNHDQLKETGSIWGNVLAGASGGLVPCIDALSILIIAASVHMILFGLVIVFFFSLGLATSIIVLGLLVIRTKKLIKIEEKIGEKISIYAPLLTGIVIIFLGIGLLLTR